VKGIQIRLDASVDSTYGTPALCVELSGDGGNTWSSAEGVLVRTSQQTFILGGTSATWGRSWTAAQMSGNSLRVRITMSASTTSRDFSLDYIAVNVTYAQ
jgi:hypothetical protein